MSEQVYFTLYDIDAMRNKTLAEAEARCMSHVGHKYIRLTIADDGDGLEIKEARFMTRDDLIEERRQHNELLDTMRADANGEIEG